MGTKLAEFFSIFLQAILLIAVPIITSSIAKYFRSLSQKATNSGYAEELQIIEDAVKTVVNAAEQVGLVEQLAGTEKRDLAIDMAEELLGNYGINVDITELATLIEAEVMRQFNDPSLPSNLPSTKQEIIKEVINAALKAVEQSGLDKATGNIIEKKFAYALKIATRYLNELNMSVDGNLLKNLIITGLNSQISDMTTADKRQQLIDQIVDASIHAAEQSGNEGLLPNDGSVKKSYAIHFAKKLFSDYSIDIEDDVLSGMVEARIGYQKQVFNTTTKSY